MALTSCIEPPLVRPAEKVMVETPLVVTDLEVVWNVNVDWKHDWYYGWDENDISIWGDLEYPEPTSYEVRRYFLGDTRRVPHTNVDPFTIYTNRFQRTYEFGYYDMLIYSNIDSKDHTQVVKVIEDDLDETVGTTTVTRAMKISRTDENLYALFNQPEIYYSAYPRDIYISRNFDDYDYYDEEAGVYVKHINSVLEPLVYVYLMQVILHNNIDNRVEGTNGNCAITGVTARTNVNTGHTYNDPCMVYFESRMKTNIDVRGEKCNIIGGKLTTYGLCDMEGYGHDNRSPLYNGSRDDIHNYIILELKMSGGSIQKRQFDVTDQMRSQCHGGVITIELDCTEVPNPNEGGSTGSLFHPTVEDYEELIFDIPM